MHCQLIEQLVINKLDRMSDEAVVTSFWNDITEFTGVAEEKHEIIP
jgi:hypothetical protein